MIPKVVRAKDGKGTGGTGFRGCIEYITKKTDHTVALRNLDSLVTAPRDMRAIAGPDANKPVYHLIISWAALENPTDEQMVEAADAALAKLGLSNHQAVIAVHRDRDHQHVHIVVNKIGIDGRAADLGHDFARLEKVCREVELKQGWAQDRGKFEPVIRPDGTVSLSALETWPQKKQRPTDGELGRERRTGEEPLSDYLSRDEILEDVGACFEMARTWDELHQMLAGYGLRYVAKGSGAKLVNMVDETDTASPSHVDKSWARSKLEARLGSMPVSSDVPPDIAIDVRPMIKHRTNGTAPHTPADTLVLREFPTSAQAADIAATRRRLANLQADQTQQEDRVSAVAVMLAEREISPPMQITEQEKANDRLSRIRQHQDRRDRRKDERSYEAAGTAGWAVQNRPGVRNGLGDQRGPRGDARRADAPGGDISGDQGPASPRRTAVGIGGRLRNLQQRVLDHAPGFSAPDLDREKRQAYKLRLLSEMYAGRISASLRDDLQRIDRRARDGRITVQLRTGSMVVDVGDRVTTSNGRDSRALACMIELAKAKGWKSVQLNGSREFQIQAAMGCARAGLKITNADPDLVKIVEMVRREMAARPPAPADSHFNTGGAAATDVRNIGRPDGSPQSARQRCWQRYSAAVAAGKAQATQRRLERVEMQIKHADEREGLEQQLRRRHQSLGQTFGLPRGVTNPFLSWHQSASARDRDQVQTRQQAERAALRAQHKAEEAAGGKLPEWRAWIDRQAAAGDADAILVKEIRAGRPNKDAPQTAKAFSNSKDELEAMRRIDLPRLAQALGYSIDAAESSRHSVKLRRNSEVIIAAQKDGVWSYFNTQSAGDQGGVIQFAQVRIGPAAMLGDVRKFLRPHLANIDVATPVPVPARERDHTAARQAWQGAKASAPSYLAERGISKATLETYAQGDQVRQDWRGNALFAHRDQAENVVGFEVKGPRWSGFAKGGQKAIAVFGTAEARQQANRIVVTESGIDALSLAQIERQPDTLYVSTGGSLGQRTILELQALLGRHPDATVMLGFDNDNPGDAFAVQVANQIDRPSSRLKPTLKDWNDDLRQAGSATTVHPTSRIK